MQSINVILLLYFIWIFGFDSSNLPILLLSFVIIINIVWRNDEYVTLF